MAQATNEDLSKLGDERLAELLMQVTDLRQKNQSIDLDELTADCPGLKNELRELLNIAEVADSVAKNAKASAETVFYPPPGDDQIPALPRQFANYELQEEIGRGGMGVVFKALDCRLRRHVAMKMILQRQHASSEELQRFHREAQAAAGLSHRNIVPVYDVGEHDGQAYFSMQYIEGMTLAKLVQGGPLPSRRAAKYIAAIARAVHHAHEQGILHRDLKPSNVLIDGDNQPMVTDFGLAKRVEGGASLTGTGAIVGTPCYMAPEQADTMGRITPASDVYSLGAILYELLTGHPPFQAANIVDVLLQVRSEEPVRPRLLNSSIDADLELICLKCLEKRAEHRYRSAQELADDLNRYLNSEPVLARSSSLVYFIGRLFRETHHAAVMEHWGSLWMWHSLQIFMLCLITNIMHWCFQYYHVDNDTAHTAYLILWSFGLIVWGSIFWQLRRMAGPVSFVERQVAHAWGAGVIASISTFIVEVILGLPPLALTPVLAIMAGMVFLFKAGTLTGWFYVAAALSFGIAIPMSLPGLQDYGPLLFGIVSGIGFFVPGLRYYRQKRRSIRLGEV